MRQSNLPSLAQNKGLTNLLNLVGLVIGWTGFILLYGYVYTELNHDTNIANYASIYRVNYRAGADSEDKQLAIGSKLMDDQVKSNIPEVVSSCRILRPQEELVFLANNEYHAESNLLYATHDFVELFAVKLLSGSKLKALQNPNTVLLSKETATQYFGTDDVVGKTITLTGKFGDRILTVEGTFQKPHSHLSYDLLISGATEPVWNIDVPIFNSYIKTNGSTPKNEVEAKVNEWVKKNTHDPSPITLTSLPDLYFDSDYLFDFSQKGNLSYVRLIFLAMGSVLLISLANFFILRLVELSRNIKRFAMLQLFGARGWRIFFLLLFQNGIVLIFAFLLAVLAALLVVRQGTDFLGTVIGPDKIDFAFWGLPVTVIIIFGVALSLVQAVLVTKNGLLNGMRQQFWFLRKRAFTQVALAIQLVLSLTIVMVTIAIFRQTNFLNSREVGFNRVNTFVIASPHNVNESGWKQFKAAVASLPWVASTSTAKLDLIGIVDKSFLASGKQQVRNKVDVFYNQVDSSFFKTVGIQRVEGEIKGGNGNIIINKSAERMLQKQQETVIGTRWYFASFDSIATIAAVVNDFHFEGFDRQVAPMVLAVKNDIPKGKLFISAEAKTFMSHTVQLEDLWRRMNFTSPFRYAALDELSKQLLNKENSLKQLSWTFSLVVVAISLIGLLSVLAYFIQSNRKNDAIRIIHGASLGDVVLRCNAKFMFLLLFSAIVALWLGSQLAQQWLAEFAYRVQMSFIDFGLIAITCLISGILVLSLFCFSQISRQPIKDLKAE